MSKFMTLQGLLALVCFAHCVYLVFTEQYEYIAAFFLCGMLNAFLAVEKWQEMKKVKRLSRIIEERY